MYQRKTKDEYHVLVNYLSDDGWEHEVTETTRKEANIRLKEYMLNTDYPVRVRKVRVKIDE